jgi:hypothetical protein
VELLSAFYENLISWRLTRFLPKPYQSLELPPIVQLSYQSAQCLCRKSYRSKYRVHFHSFYIGTETLLHVSGRIETPTGLRSRSKAPLATIYCRIARRLSTNGVNVFRHQGRTIHSL